MASMSLWDRFLPKELVSYPWKWKQHDVVERQYSGLVASWKL